jgi:hypothetical protein
MGPSSSLSLGHTKKALNASSKDAVLPLYASDGVLIPHLNQDDLQAVAEFGQHTEQGDLSIAVSVGRSGGAEGCLGTGRGSSCFPVVLVRIW